MSLPQGATPIVFTPPVTPAETKVIEGLLQGKTNKSIALDLQVTEKTIKFHLTNIYKKQKVKNRTELLFKEIKRLQEALKANNAS